ncbi:MAG: hypothetical protein JWR80_8093 [Bradyrhizobium sp.]|nr:hypothetical protein [Bradyrhizobium sp.]
MDPEGRDIETAGLPNFGASYPPLAMNRRQALKYTGLSAKWFGELERAGKLVGKNRGPNGSTIFLTEQLREVVAELFAPAGSEYDFEFA